MPKVRKVVSMPKVRKVMTPGSYGMHGISPGRPKKNGCMIANA